MLGPVSVMAAMVFFSINDVTIKAMSDRYALHLIVLVRSLLSLLVLMVFIVPASGGLAGLRTRRLPAHLMRAGFVVMANMSFFLGLAAMPIAEAVAIFFVSPLIITVMSVLILKERVGPRRWTAIGVGLVGVLIVVRPGTEAFQLAALLPLFAALCYASLNIMTRRLGNTEGPAAMTFYIQITFIAVASAIGLVIGDGRFGGFEDPSLSFFFKAWSWPEMADLWLFAVIGVATAMGGYLVSLAYKVGEAALIAPFEYVALPISIVWGIVIFDEWPDTTAILGILLILASGLFVVVRSGPSRPDPALRR